MIECRIALGRLAVCVAALIVLGGCSSAGRTQPVASPAPVMTVDRPLRIFWVNSQMSDDRWVQQIRTGVWEALARGGYSLAEGTLVWQAYDLDASPADPMAAPSAHIAGALAALEDFGPDVVMLSDGAVAEAIISRFPVGQIQFVVCDLNAPVEVPSLLREDVAIVVKQLHPMQTVAMAREFTGGSGDYLLIGDGSLSGEAVTRVAYEVLVRDYGESVPYWGTADSWEAWKALVLEHMDDLDFVLISGYQPLLDAEGLLIDGRTMMAWMLKTIPVPVFALSNSVVVDGAVGGLVVDGYEHGRLAGQLAIGATRGTSVLSVSSAVAHNRLVLNAAAARHWGLRIPTLFPIAAEVYSSLPVLQGGQ